jgi:hypothetical protein
MYSARRMFVGVGDFRAGQREHSQRLCRTDTGYYVTVTKYQKGCGWGCDDAAQGWLPLVAKFGRPMIVSAINSVTRYRALGGPLVLDERAAQSPASPLGHHRGAWD